MYLHSYDLWKTNAESSRSLESSNSLREACRRTPAPGAGLLNRRAALLCLTAAFGSFRKTNAEEDKGDVYEPGGDVKPPKLVHYVEPEFSPSSKEAYVEGTVKISTVVTTEGKATDCRVTSGLSAEEDRTAVEALKQWRFQAGTKSGAPVKVRITVEIDFHLL